jgi:hypothetical protein
MTTARPDHPTTGIDVFDPDLLLYPMGPEHPFPLSLLQPQPSPALVPGGDSATSVADLLVASLVPSRLMASSDATSAPLFGYADSYLGVPFSAASIGGTFTLVLWVSNLAVLCLLALFALARPTVAASLLRVIDLSKRPAVDVDAIEAAALRFQRTSRESHRFVPALRRGTLTGGIATVLVAIDALYALFVLLAETQALQDTPYSDVQLNTLVFDDLPASLLSRAASSVSFAELPSELSALARTASVQAGQMLRFEFRAGDWGTSCFESGLLDLPEHHRDLTIMAGSSGTMSYLASFIEDNIPELAGLIGRTDLAHVDPLLSETPAPAISIQTPGCRYSGGVECAVRLFPEDLQYDALQSPAVSYGCVADPLSPAAFPAFRHFILVDPTILQATQFSPEVTISVTPQPTADWPHFGREISAVELTVIPSVLAWFRDDSAGFVTTNTHRASVTELSLFGSMLAATKAYWGWCVNADACDSLDVATPFLSQPFLIGADPAADLGSFLYDTRRAVRAGTGPLPFVAALSQGGQLLFLSSCFGATASLLNPQYPDLETIAYIGDLCGQFAAGYPLDPANERIPSLEDGLVTSDPKEALCGRQTFSVSSHSLLAVPPTLPSGGQRYFSSSQHTIEVAPTFVSGSCADTVTLAAVIAWDSRASLITFAHVPTADAIGPLIIFVVSLAGMHLSMKTAVALGAGLLRRRAAAPDPRIARKMRPIVNPLAAASVSSV